MSYPLPDPREVARSQAFAMGIPAPYAPLSLQIHGIKARSCLGGRADSGRRRVMADRAQVQGIGEVVDPGGILRSALKKIVFFESRVSQLERAARSTAERPRADDPVERVRLLEGERERLLSGLVERARVGCAPDGGCAPGAFRGSSSGPRSRAATAVMVGAGAATEGLRPGGRDPARGPVGAARRERGRPGRGPGRARGSWPRVSQWTTSDTRRSA